MDPNSTRAEASAPGPSSAAATGQENQPPSRRRKNRGGKKKRSRRKSFHVTQDEIGQDEERPLLDDPALAAARETYYHNRNLSNTSVDSQTLLDHREQPHFLRPRRPSLAPASSSGQHAPQVQISRSPSRLGTVHAGDSGDEDDEGAPLLSSSARLKSDTALAGGYGGTEQKPTKSRSRRQSSASSRKKFSGQLGSSLGSHNVNYPPSMPGSPRLEAKGLAILDFADALLRDDTNRGRETMSDHSSDERPKLQSSPLNRRHTIAFNAEEDVCFPQDGLSEIADDDHDLLTRDPTIRMRSRRRRGKWPNLELLEEYSRQESVTLSDAKRAKRITEPQLINGRLRPTSKKWLRSEEDAPYRFTYLNEDNPTTIHSSTISELVQLGGSFKELFLPDPPILSDSSDSSDDEEVLIPEPIVAQRMSQNSSSNGISKTASRQPSVTSGSQAPGLRDRALSPTSMQGGPKDSRSNSGAATPGVAFESPSRPKSPETVPIFADPKPVRYGERPVWWLDVLSPTPEEMRVINHAFHIHPLTSEDIMEKEAREKVELFRNYYFVSYRSFEQDENSEDYLEPINIYLVVFRQGVISFHHSPTPHPSNVRRRVRQLRDYMKISSDWISYAMIDDITDTLVPLIKRIEDEVDEIDDEILMLHSGGAGDDNPYVQGNNKGSDSGRNSEEDEKKTTQTMAESGAHMLRRVGDCRKRVMALYRLLGNKADVIKGFAKRCNEHWEVAPRSEIGLYLGDIQDHIITMTNNLNHYEKILGRAHGNYLAQINIKMNERAEQTADVLGKLTVLGTIVLPMNIITGLWGMNVWVPGQEYEGDLTWFWCITAGLLVFGLACFLIAKRVYKIV